MSKPWIQDLWVKDDRTSGQRVAPTSVQLRNIKKLPQQFRTARFGQGKRWRLAWYEPGSSKPKTEGFETRSEAEARKAELEDGLRSGKYIAPEHGRQRFKTVGEAWLASKRRIKESSYRRYRRDLERWVYPKWGDTPIDRITRTGIDAWIVDLEEGNAPVAKGQREATKLSARSIHSVVRIALGAPLRYAVTERWLASSPLENVELPSLEAEDREMMILTHKEVALIAKELAAIGRPVDGKLCLFLAYTGLRINEALALKHEHIDFKKRRIYVREAWSVDKQGNRKLTAPKHWERRDVPLAKFLVPELEAIKDNESEWVFNATRGDAIFDTHWRSRHLNKATANIGIEGVTPHVFRHTAASIAIAAGADIKLLQLMLGHKDATETLNTYGHLWPSKLDEVTDAMSLHRATELGIPT